MGSEPANQQVSGTLPCPFCGFSHVRVSVDRSRVGAIAKCQCNICGATVYGVGLMIPEDGGPTDELTESAIEAWNTRTEPRAEQEASNGNTD